MKEHLFKENIEDLYSALMLAVKLYDRLPQPSFYKAECKIIIDHLTISITELEYAIEDYEEGITEDIDKTKKEIMEALKRL